MSVIDATADVAKSAIESLRASPTCLALVLLSGAFVYITYLDSTAERQRIFEAAQAQRDRDYAQNDKILDRCLSAYEARETRQEERIKSYQDRVRLQRRDVHENVPPELLPSPVRPGEETR